MATHTNCCGNGTTSSRRIVPITTGVPNTKGSICGQSSISASVATTNEKYLFGAEYSAGIYVLKVINDGKIETFKIVKLK